MQQKSIMSFDGTRIAYLVGGSGDRWLVVANGYGGSFWAWTELFECLKDRYRLLLWDYRGLYASQIPADRSNLTIEDNCRDLDRLMEAEGIRRMVLAGWSVGVQVALEQYGRRPDAVEALVLINGSHGRVLHRSLDGRLAGILLPPLVARTRRLTPLLAPLLLPPLRLLARFPLTLRLLSLAGLVGDRPERLQTALRSVLTLDYSVYLQMGLLADAHDADDLLPVIRVPTLVTAGERDIITPPRVGRAIAARIPGAVFFEIPRGTHYSVMEFPRLLANRIDSFIRGHLDHPAG